MQPRQKVLLGFTALIWPFVVLAASNSPLMIDSGSATLKTTSIDEALTITLDNPTTINISSEVPDLKNFTSSTLASAQTDVYQYQTGEGTQVIQFNFQNQLIENDNFNQKIIYLKTDNDTWQALASYYNPNDNSIWATTSQAVGQVILGAKNDIWEGQASWYSWKHCPCAAFKLAPKNSILKVTNLQKGKNFGRMKYIQVNDYGPEDSTNRLIDLDKTVFSSISNLGAGLIQVRVELVTDSKELIAAKKATGPQKISKTK